MCIVIGNKETTLVKFYEELVIFVSFKENMEFTLTILSNKYKFPRR